VFRLNRDCLADFFTLQDKRQTAVVGGYKEVLSGSHCHTTSPGPHTRINDDDMRCSGREGTVHIDHVLEYNRDPSYMRDLLLYQLTVQAAKLVEQTGLSKRELIRRMGTSPSQFYRLLDKTNYRKSLDQLVSLLRLLDYDVEINVRRRAA